MKKFLFSATAAMALAIYPAGAASSERTATFTSTAVADSGSCKVEVVVPGEARVRIHRDTAKLEHVSGRAPEWRTFECTSAMPTKPTDFRVETNDSRGKQELVHGPRGNGGTAVVYIADPKHGEGTYTFNVIWGNAPTKP